MLRVCPYTCCARKRLNIQIWLPNPVAIRFLTIIKSNGKTSCTDQAIRVHSGYTWLAGRKPGKNVHTCAIAALCVCGGRLQVTTPSWIAHKGSECSPTKTESSAQARFNLVIGSIFPLRVCLITAGTIMIDECQDRSSKQIRKQVGFISMRGRCNGSFACGTSLTIVPLMHQIDPHICNQIWPIQVLLSHFRAAFTHLTHVHTGLGSLGCPGTGHWEAENN